MVFSSPIFIFLFLPVVILVYYFINVQFRNLLLLIASLFFYAWGEPKVVFLMIFSILLNYSFGILIEHYNKRLKISRIIVAIAIISNLSFLIYYKYINFILDNFNNLLIGFEAQPIVIDKVSLPIGISFFTFHVISYIIDAYKGKTPIQKNPLLLGLYVSFFPQLVAGPIVRYHDIAEQLTKRTVDLNGIAYGTQRFVLGLGKKVLISNPLAQVADQIFSSNTNELTSPIAWLGIICYTLQLYFDFSGYSDMAIGLGRIFGFKFLENFNYPYISKSIQEFWRRWHISLSTWFRDYLYIPLGGNRVKKSRFYFNLLIVWLATGIWHGASWNFIIWGLFHGLFIIIERVPAIKKVLGALWSPFQHIYALLIVIIGWVFFRAEDLNYAIEYLRSMFMLQTPEVVSQYASMYLNNEVYLALLFGIVGSTPIIKSYSKLYDLTILKLNSNNNKTFKYTLGYLMHAVKLIGLVLIFIFTIASLASNTYNPFIYFRF
ncbi:MBOAT family protein [Paenibacillus sp. LMG 31461]|uniref:MBOAT family protein n=1 Tax=Paenibacillus plantarum TaxID=2654975 RepID=A0ABX1XCV9_9BACL|nr:MBOAT family protein [Paenibacillus plantarum]NOU66236.1 MBOAT family protein [Paenibacillus plantarum]